MCRRFTCLINPYVDSSLTRFIDLIRSSGAVITGSVARAMMTGHQGGTPRNLNIIIPYQSFQSLHAFIKHELGYLATSEAAHPAIATAVNLFCKYESKQRIITLSAPRPSQSVLQIIMNAPSTADMVVMSAGGVAWFYPCWLRQGISVQTRSSEFVSHNYQLGYVGDLTQDIELRKDLQFTQRACGTFCPTFWHHVEDKSLRCFVDWNGEDTVTEVFKGVDLEWRLSPDCTNSRCSYRTAVMELNIDGNGAHSSDDVRYIPGEIAWRLPRFLQLITGVFYGSDCTRPYLVPVPVRDGVERPPTLDDLDISYWVRQFEYRQCTASRRILRHTFDAVPYTGLSVGGQYTVFFEIPSDTSSQNELLSRMSKLSGCDETVLGSILVMKQSTDQALVDMTKGDQLVSNCLVSRYVPFCCKPFIIYNHAQCPAFRGVRTQPYSSRP
ncbi:hypothetical protein P692DRAFT_20730620 [Suillus brevipes Sb2]|nr:hypothetical protein P692DRAFT_20730620 [Suillus brevipes Sb2]